MPSSRLPLPSHISPSFSFLSPSPRRWALDFLLDYATDASGDLSALSNPISYSHSAATSSTSILHPPSDPSSANPISIETSTLLVPVWHAAGVTCGISALRFLHTPIDPTTPSSRPSSPSPSVSSTSSTSSSAFTPASTDTPPPLPLPFLPATGAKAIAIGRFARDERTGETLQLLSCVGADCFAPPRGQGACTGARGDGSSRGGGRSGEAAADDDTRVCASHDVFVLHAAFERAAVRVQTVVQCAAAASQSPSAARPALDALLRDAHTAKTATLIRDCPVCGAGVLAADRAGEVQPQCACQLPFEPSAAGLDFRAFRKNAQRAEGDYMGRCVVVGRETGVGAVGGEEWEARSVTMKTQVRERGCGPDDVLSAALRDVVVQERLASTSLDHEVVRLFGQAPVQEGVGGVDFVGDGSGSDCLRDNGQCRASSVDTVDASVPGLASACVGVDLELDCPQDADSIPLSSMNEFFDAPDAEQMTTLTSLEHGAQQSEATKEQTAEWKRRERQRKNREAATRANQRRREYRITLVESVAHEKQRAEELRARYAQLKELNSELRRKCEAVAAW